MAKKRQNKCCCKNNISVVLQQCQNHGSFQRNGSGAISNFFANYFQELAVFGIRKRGRSTFLKCGENFNTMPDSFHPKRTLF